MEYWSDGFSNLNSPLALLLGCALFLFAFQQLFDPLDDVRWLIDDFFR
jgi:hypothetical protein